jgi:hypothetical protein
MFYFRKKRIKKLLIGFLVIFILYLLVSFRTIPEEVDYGVSFNTLYAKELGLNWVEVYSKILNELKPEKIRLAAHWDMIEPQKDSFNFSELDFQVNNAAAKNVEIIMAVGKRLPRWPECHIPDWAFDLSKEETESEILEYIDAVVSRYKDNDAIKIWQVENEPFLSFFAKEHCIDFDKDFLDKEIELVETLDPSREILITDSGELSTWRNAYKRGDIFGNTLYIYAWNEWMGDFRSFVLPGFYSAKRNIWNLVYGKKEAIIAELSLEPWLDKPVIEEDTAVQIQRMSPEKFENVLKFAKQTGFKTQYLWGAEWWYYMKLQGEDWYWERGKEVFRK